MPRRPTTSRSCGDYLVFLLAEKNSEIVDVFASNSPCLTATLAVFFAVRRFVSCLSIFSGISLTLPNEPQPPPSDRQGCG